MDVSHLFREMEAGTPVRVVLLSEASEDELGGISEIMGIGLSTEEM